MKNSVLLDTNILVYAVNAESDFHDGAVDLLEDQEQRYVLTQQNLVEFFRVVTNPRHTVPMTYTQAINTVRFFSESFLVLQSDALALDITWDLVERYGIEGYTIFDTQLVATGLRHGVTHIATHDTDFRRFDEIQVIDPFVD
jgi:hypothetical protein